MPKTKLDREYYYKLRDKFVHYARNPMFKTLPPKIQGEHKRCLDIIEAIVICGETPKLKRTFMAQLKRVNAMMGEFCQMHPDFKSAGWGVVMRRRSRLPLNDWVTDLIMTGLVGLAFYVVYRIILAV